jgi:hypothetical protein
MERGLQLGAVFDDPPVDRGVIDVHPMFQYQFFDMARAQRIGHVPADAHENDVLGEMGSFEADRHRRSPSLWYPCHSRRAYPKAAQINDKIRLMKQSELGRAHADFDRRMQALAQAAGSGDIHATPLIFGVLTITEGQQ